MGDIVYTTPNPPLRGFFCFGLSCCGGVLGGDSGIEKSILIIGISSLNLMYSIILSRSRVGALLGSFILLVIIFSILEGGS